MKKLFRHFICWLSRQYGWITSASGIVLAVFGAWSQLPKIHVLGYRPDDQIFFWGIIIASITATAIGMIRSWANAYKIDDIETKNAEKIKYFQDMLFQERMESLKDHLREIAEGLQFTMQERICVYRFVEADNNFECIGRYSSHHEYDQFSVRKRYPSDVGIIAHVWRDAQLNGFKRDSNIPNPATSKARYFKYLKDTYGISREVAKHFRMNPVDIIAQVVRDTKSKPVAIIIFESQRNNFLDEQKINLEYNDFKKVAITASLDKLKEQHSPDSNTAKEAQL